MATTDSEKQVIGKKEKGNSLPMFELGCRGHRRASEVPALSVEVYLRSRGSSRRQSHPGIPLSPGSSLTESLNRLALGSLNSSSADLSENAIRSGHKDIGTCRPAGARR